MHTAPALPSTATAASLARLELARRLTAHCPPPLGAAIALTGSSARGLADDDSDAEINHWVERMPPLKVRAAYLTATGVTDLEAESSPRSDGSEWFQGRVGAISIEIGWQTFDRHATSIRPLLSGETTSAESLRLGELLASALVLRTDDRLLVLKDAVTRFPDPLRNRLIAELSAGLGDEAAWAALDRLARRGERLTAIKALAAMLKTAVRLCYALNRRWEASDKWLLTLAANLPVMPPDWRARLDAALSAAPMDAVALARDWCDDALALPR